MTTRSSTPPPPHPWPDRTRHGRPAGAQHRSDLPGPGTAGNDKATVVTSGDVVCPNRCDIAAIAGLAARAPAVQAWATWLIADPHRREQLVPPLCVVLVEHALRHGHVDVIAERATAIWLDHTTTPSATCGLVQRLAALCGPDTTMQGRLDLAPTRLPATPHLYLAVLAAGGREAAALLAHRNLRLDRVGVTAYARASSLADLDLLTAAGYQPDEQDRPPAGPHGWSMRRLPRGRRNNSFRFWPPDIG